MQTEHDQATVTGPETADHIEKYDENGVPRDGMNVGPGVRKSTKGGTLGRIGSSPWVTWGLRILQFSISIIALALAAYSLNKFFNSERRMRYTAFVGSFSLIYLIILGILSFASPSFVMAGPVLIMEVLLAILWLCSFIALASRYSGFSCKRSNNRYRYASDGYESNGSVDSGYNYIRYPYYSGSSYISGCRSGKAAIAFAAFSWLLFSISSILLLWNVFRRLARNKRINSMFQPGSKNGVRLDKPALAFNRDYDPDVEYQGATGTIGQKYVGTQDVESAGDTHTYTNEGVTTGDYNNNAEYNNNVGGYNNTTNDGYNNITGHTHVSGNTGNAGINTDGGPQPTTETSGGNTGVDYPQQTTYQRPN